MHSPKAASGNHFFSPRTQKFRSPDGRLNTVGDPKTEEQQERIRKLIHDVRNGGPLSPKAVIIPQSELRRIKNSSIAFTKEELRQQKKLLREQNQKHQVAAQAKKQKMLELEVERKTSIPSVAEVEPEKKVKTDSLQARAQALLNEEKDEVKHMNQIMMYARVGTIRDHQMEERTAIWGEFKQDEMKKDLLMEVERLKKIRHFDELERLKKEEQKKKAMELMRQIKERELERLREQEEVEREGQDMVRRIRDLQMEEVENNKLKRRQQQELLDQINVANGQSIAHKQEKVRQERLEEERILQYLVEKSQKEIEHQAELKRMKDEKEREVQRLREMQEKASDRLAEMDALRAKRATEMADRQAKEKERMEAENRADINKNLADDRKVQAMKKEELLREQARLEKEQFDKIVVKQKVEADRELKMEHERIARVRENAEHLKRQIAANEEKKRKARLEYLEEGKKIKESLNAERRLLESIKTRKLGELVSESVSPKYVNELVKKKIEV